MDKITYRSQSIAAGPDGAPSTLDVENRSVEAIGSTEAPVMERDYDTWEVYPTILLMSGCQIPASRQLPLLDTHSRYDTASVIGSYRDMRIEGDKLVGRAVFSAAPEAESAWLKTQEGHLTDYSVARVDEEATIIPAGQTGLIGGRSYIGPVKVVTRWKPKEMSVCPIGADENAKARAATAQPETTTKENKNMSTEAQNRGLSEEATTKVQPVDLDAVRADAVRAENRRMTEINDICRRFDVPEEKRAEFAKPDVSVDFVRKAVLDLVAERASEHNPGFRPAQKIEAVADERDKFRAAANDALLIRCGQAPEQLAAGARDIAGFSLREMARESLRMSGQSFSGSPLEMVGRALTTSDFPLILANVANKSLFAGYEAAAETWQKWCGTGQTNDFKTNTVVRAGEGADLDQIREDDEYKYGARAEAQEQFSIATYGKLFSISRQAIINDDLGALTDIPAMHGEAAARKIGDLAYAVLTANSAMGDGKALFHADHGNIGTKGVFGTTTMGEAIKLMALQKDIGGKRRLNIIPRFILAPPSIAQTILTFLASEYIGTQALPNQRNIYANMVEPIIEPRLYDASATAWYLAGDKGKTVNLYFLNGNQTPYMETKQGWNVDGVEYKVRIDAGAKAIDWKSMLYNAGS